ncbi:hypothetical protein [Propionivibrio soli]|uniref:hypothetical protein n=1 Tax=Propionivibrio soli TaxID=2976531 RepID=UPI0021E7BD4A|nr:hypothetical protein [Propionivibrio soli]
MSSMINMPEVKLGVVGVFRDFSGKPDRQAPCGTRRFSRRAEAGFSRLFDRRRERK